MTTKIALRHLELDVLAVGQTMLEYSISLEGKPGARLEDAVFIRKQAEKLCEAIEHARHMEPE